MLFYLILKEKIHNLLFIPEASVHFPILPLSFRQINSIVNYCCYASKLSFHIGLSYCLNYHSMLGHLIGAGVDPSVLDNRGPSGSQVKARGQSRSTL